jgi:hypothetical protein
VRKNSNRNTILIVLAGLLACFLCAMAIAATPEGPTDDSTAVCPIVYQLDQSPTAHGYHYTFFGNGFFINEDGYILTVAHVLETFRDGGQPYILVSRPNSPPMLVKADLIAADKEHDVAILRATPNPFSGSHKVTFLPLASDPVRGQPVIALSLHPPKLQNARTFDLPREDRSPGQVLSYESTKLDKSAPAADVFLLSHPVTLGQSGSPVLSTASHAVVGLIEGRWLRSSGITQVKSMASDSVPGAAIPIRHAIALLQEHSISWHSVPSAKLSEPSDKNL